MEAKTCVMTDANIGYEVKVEAGAGRVGDVGRER